VVIPDIVDSSSSFMALLSLSFFRSRIDIGYTATLISKASIV
jgi:hypothetical protein